jgi:hypothetical protein
MVENNQRKTEGKKCLRDSSLQTQFSYKNVIKRKEAGIRMRLEG